MEIRISDQTGPLSIVAEVWRFSEITQIPDDHFALGIPQLPQFWEVFQIQLQAPSDGEPLKTKFFWYIHEEDAVVCEDASSETYTPSFHRLSSTSQSTYVQISNPFQNTPHVDSGYCHPEFPDLDRHPWYDKEREPPRIQQEPSLVIDSSRRPFHTGRYLYTVNTGVMKPWAISIFPLDRSGGLAGNVIDLSYLHNPINYWEDYRSTDLDDDLGQNTFGKQKQIHPRYYPLRFIPPPPDDAPGPGEIGWTPELLEGLWLGSYSAHGTEVLYLEWNRTENEIKAHKVTGDTNVPRGIVSWKFSLESKEDTTPPSIDEFGPDMKPCPVYWTTATVADHGYSPSGRGSMRAIAALMSNDEIRVRWRDFASTSIMRRYPGRNPGTEEHVEGASSGIMRFAEEW